MSKNKARDIERKITTITKNVKDAWEKLEYPNLFGGGPVMDPHGKLISLNITAFGHVAAFLRMKRYRAGYERPSERTI